MRPTGSTVTRIVASRATMKDMMERLNMINHSFFVGFHSFASFNMAFSRSVVEEEAEGEVFGVSAILVV